MKQLNAIHFGSVLIILFFAIVAVFTPFSFYGCGGGGAGGGAAGAGASAGGNPIDGGPVDYSLHIIGRVVNQGGALPNISAAIFPAVPLSGWEVYLESYPSIETVTDANGKFTLTPVPAGNHRVVVKLLSGTQLFKSRSRIISVGGAANEADAGDLPAAPATSRVRGILKDIQGNPVTGTPLSLWGEVFFTDTQGSYESPLMPDNSGGVISVKDPRFKSIDLEFVFSSPNPPYLETMMVPPGQTNGAPDVRVLANAYSVNAGFPLSLTASATDPEGDQLSYFWSASTGSISTGTNPAQANWTAPVEGSIATVALEVRDPAGLSAKYFVGLTILGSRPDTTPPTILAVLPASGSTGVLTSAAISIAFSEPMDPTTLNSTSITLASGAVPISGNITVSTDGKAATFTPTAALPYESTIDAAIATAAKDIVGNALAANMLWAFTTIAAPDTAAPTIVSVTPADNATNVASGSSIEANFSEAMASGTITATTFTVASGGTAIAGGVSLSLDGKTATFIPIAALPYESSIAATIATGAKDLAGNALAANKLWAFTTTPVPDTTAPTIVSVTPGDAATNIATGSQIEATFSEAMASGTITATTFKVASGGAAIAGSVSLSADGKTATFTPTAALPYESLITATITTGAKDIAGNAVAANKVWAFTTTVAPDTTPPTIVSVAPADAATNIATGSPIAAQFSEMMASGTITATTFKVASGGTTIAGSVSLSTDGKIATFTPTTALPYGSSVTATITTGVTDLAGNALAANKVWAFTTVAPPDTTPPTIVSVAPADAATGVATGSPIAARFSEAMDSGTFTGTTFTLASGGIAIAGSISLSADGKTATFTPTAALPYESSITATITTGVTDLAGNALAANKVWAFTTIAPPDIIPPTVVSLTPADAATGIAVGSPIAAKFSEAMDSGTITGTTFTVASGGTAIGGSIVFSADSKAATFTPTAALPYGSVITATITTDVTDLAGNALAADKVWAFTTTADFTPPTVSLILPASGAINVATAAVVSIFFSEAMDDATLNGTNISMASGGTNITGVIGVSGDSMMATFTPATTLDYRNLYTVTVTTGVKDTAGNPLSTNFVSTFTTCVMDTLPAGWSSVGFPGVGGSMIVHSFSASMKSVLALVNPNSNDLSVTVSADRGGTPNLGVSSVQTSVAPRIEPVLTRAESLHKFLRDFERAHPANPRPTGIAPAVRPVPPVIKDVLNQNTVFKILDTYPSYISAPSTCRAVVPLPGVPGGNANIYTDNSITWDSVASEVVDQLAASWPVIYPIVRANFGSEPPAGAFNDITLTDDIWILVADPAKMGGWGGFFWSGDLFASSTYAPSNERKIFYLTYYGNGAGHMAYSKGTLAHEFQHMVNHYERSLVGVSEEAWLNEAMSGYSEHLCGFGIPTTNDTRAANVNSFFTNVSANSLSDWAGASEDYGQVYLFGTWLGQRYGTSGSVKALLQTSAVGTAAVELFTGRPYSTVLAEWSLALYVNDSVSGGPYGILGLDLKGSYGYPWGTNVTLTGPAVTGINTYPQNTSPTVSNNTVSYIEYTGGNGNSLNFSIPANVDVYELHK